MSYCHKDLASGRWKRMSFVEQMANIGSEVERALNWKSRNNTVYSHQAAERALELLDLTVEGVRGFSRLKELIRVREAIADYFFGTNQFISSDMSWKKYFSYFAYAMRGNR